MTKKNINYTGHLYYFKEKIWVLNSVEKLYDNFLRSYHMSHTFCIALHTWFRYQKNESSANEHIYKALRQSNVKMNDYSVLPRWPPSKQWSSWMSWWTWAITPPGTRNGGLSSLHSFIRWQNLEFISWFGQWFLCQHRNSSSELRPKISRCLANLCVCFHNEIQLIMMRNTPTSFEMWNSCWKST